MNFNNTFVKAGFELWNLIYRYLKINDSIVLKSAQNDINDNSRSQNLEDEFIENSQNLQMKIYSILLNYSYFLVKLAHNDDVCNSYWVKAYLKYSKALFLNEKYDKCISVLINLLDIFSVIPLEEIKFLNVVNIKNKISIVNNYENFDIILKFYSKVHVYKKCEEIFYENHINVESEYKSKDENSIDEYNENSSRSRMSGTLSKYRNKFFDDIFAEENEKGNNENQQKEKIELKENPLIDSSEKNDILNLSHQNKPENSLNIELEKKKLETINKNILNQNKVNLSDFSLMEGNKDKNNVKTELYKKFQKIDLNENYIKEIYTDNLIYEDDIYGEGNDIEYNIRDLNVKSLNKFEEYLYNNTEKIEVPLVNLKCKKI